MLMEGSFRDSAEVLMLYVGFPVLVLPLLVLGCGAVWSVGADFVDCGSTPLRGFSWISRVSA
jgi:hypothetical protein